MDPTLIVLTSSAAAALAASLGALPLLARERLPGVWIGWASALAAGMMLGAAYTLTALEGAALPQALGALLGIAFTYWTHAVIGTQDLVLNRLEESDPVFGYKILLTDSLHSASEGVAIGVAMVADLSFGLFMALAIAAHNVPEGTVLCAVLKGQGVGRAHAAGLAVAVNVTQVLLAVVTFAVVSTHPGALPWALGFAVGALVQLVLVELLPESYRVAGYTSIAVVASIAMGMVVLLEGALH